uniref:Uncharacterized protein n=1 Tax=Ditylum brightwellii TaxID=49249 RepID=A0A6U3SIR2_9STRA|mmetsp:Transcript_31710/g.47273  ORF Transcript_31710/g.47273 Transcript_31710/m.47273 type:complete len:306 (+) Transcript_31710:95-1012(+)
MSDPEEYGCGRRAFEAFPKLRDRTIIKVPKKYLWPLVGCFVMFFIVLARTPSRVETMANRSFIRGNAGRPSIYSYMGTSEMIKFDSQSEMEEILSFWKSKWSEAGWDAIVLKEEDARLHPLFTQLEEDPGVHRWLAMSVSGGIWYADYRTYPIRMTPKIASNPPNDGLFTVHDPRFNHGYRPTLISAMTSEWERIIDQVSPYANSEIKIPKHEEVIIESNVEKQGRINVENWVASGVHGTADASRTNLDCAYYSTGTVVHMTRTDIKAGIQLGLLQNDERAQSDVPYLQKFLLMLRTQCPFAQEG